jgi:CheY-like chemotaxis protein
MSTLPEILLIEDSEHDIVLFERALAASGLPATLVCTTFARDAILRITKSGPYAHASLPAVVVLDLDLPGLNGVEFQKLLHLIIAPTRVPVVILTGSQRPEDRAQCESLGVKGYQVKPPHLSDLVSFVASLKRFLPGS